MDRVFLEIGWGHFCEKLGPLLRKVGAISAKSWGHFCEKLGASNFGAISAKSGFCQGFSGFLTLPSCGNSITMSRVLLVGMAVGNLMFL